MLMHCSVSCNMVYLTASEPQGHLLWFFCERKRESPRESCSIFISPPDVHLAQEPGLPATARCRHDDLNMKRDRNRSGQTATTPDSAGIGQASPGLITAHHGIEVEVLFATGKRRMVRVKRSSGHVVGDEVEVTGEVLLRLPRRTELRRRDGRGGIHLVAANLDVLGIVVAPHSPTGFIDRAIVAARVALLQPFVVVNKCDLEDSATLLADLQRIYAGSVPVFALSARNRTGLATLQAFLHEGHRAVFVGASGVGKSSLLNA